MVRIDGGVFIVREPGISEFRAGERVRRGVTAAGLTWSIPRVGSGSGRRRAGARLESIDAETHEAYSDVRLSSIDVPIVR
jgi:hypothetical protein